MTAPVSPEDTKQLFVTETATTSRANSSKPVDGSEPKSTAYQASWCLKTKLLRKAHGHEGYTDCVPKISNAA
jgi:hypothetical protein